MGMDGMGSSTQHSRLTTVRLCRIAYNRQRPACLLQGLQGNARHTGPQVQHVKTSQKPTIMYIGSFGPFMVIEYSMVRNRPILCKCPCPTPPCPTHGRIA